MSVMRSCRVERSSKRTPSAFSSSAIFRLRLDTGTPSRPAAFEKLPASTTLTYRAMAFLSVREIIFPSVRSWFAKSPATPLDGTWLSFFPRTFPYQPRKKEMKTTLVLAIACLCAPFAADAQAQLQSPSSFSAHHAQFGSHDRAQIETVLRTYEQSLNASDVQGVIKLYTDDAVLMAPNNPSAVGIQAVQEAYAGVFQAIRLNINFQVAELHLLSPEWAFL